MNALNIIGLALILIIGSIAVALQFRRIMQAIRSKPEPVATDSAQRAGASCPVSGCAIRTPHSHAEALLKRIREQ